MTHDSMEFFDMYKSRLRDKGVEQYGTLANRSSRRCGKKSRKVLSSLRRVLGSFLLQSGRKLVSLGEKLKQDRTGYCPVKGLNKVLPWEAAR